MRICFNINNWDPSVDSLADALARIDTCEAQRIERFYFQRDAKLALAGRLLLRYVLTSALDISSTLLQIGRSPENKPILLNKNDKGIEFNVSHHGTYAVAASDFNVAVGVDVMEYEMPRESIESFFETMEPQFSQTEWKEIRNSSNMLNAFYRQWSLKESYVKAVGKGLGIQLKTLSFKQSSDAEHRDKFVTSATLEVSQKPAENWIFEQSHIDKNHCVCVALGHTLSKKSFSTSKEEIQKRKEKKETRFFEKLTIEDLMQKLVPIRDKKEETNRAQKMLTKPKAPKFS